LNATLLRLHDPPYEVMEPDITCLGQPRVLDLELSLNVSQFRLARLQTGNARGIMRPNKIEGIAHYTFVSALRPQACPGAGAHRGQE
jgi:hypothetical protein